MEFFDVKFDESFVGKILPVKRPLGSKDRSDKNKSVVEYGKGKVKK